MPRSLAIGTGGAAGASVGPVIAGYFKGLPLKDMLKDGMKGGEIGLVLGTVQGGLEAAIRAGNDCDCKQK
jgi:hypothetical protein